MRNGIRDSGFGIRNVDLIAVIMFCSCMAACNRQAQAPAPSPVPSAEARIESFSPGLGEIMTLQQMRHTKLWLAGSQGNWALAGYEVKELGEGFDDVVKFHPTHEESPVAPKDAIPRIITVPLADVRAAVEKKDRAGFEQAYDALTKACNDCHQATNFGFNVVQKPTSNPYPNQVFEPKAQ